MLRRVVPVSNVSADEALVIRPVSEVEVRSALSLILAPGDRLATDKEVQEFLGVSNQRGIDLSKLVAGVMGNRMLWAVLPMETRGRTLQLLSPNHFFDAAQPAAAGRVVEAICAQYAQRGCQLAQVLVEPASSPMRVLYGEHGFIEMAELKYLQATPRGGKPVPPLPPDFYFEHYSPQTHALFAQAIVGSYQQSLDCPALAGLRDIEDVIQGHRAAGGPTAEADFDGQLWRVLLQRQPAPLPPLPCGVMLLCRIDSHETIELVYIGLAAPVRRRGLGAILLRHAMADTAAEGRRLSLAVDSRNTPALKLYYRHGFQKVGEKIAMIRDLRPPPGLPA
jgi:ribosomal protein S18 acetylase RimI-like enzyme